MNKRDFLMVVSLLSVGCEISAFQAAARRIFTSAAQRVFKSSSLSKLWQSAPPRKKLYTTASVISSGLMALYAIPPLKRSSDQPSSLPGKPRFLPDERPPHVQAAVDEAFERNRKSDIRSWTYKGCTGFYEILCLKERALLQQLAHENPEKKDIYIVDVGCGQGAWGQKAMETLVRQMSSTPSAKRFHIFSVTGGQECDEQVLHNGNVTLYQFNQFKIENLDEEFACRGFDLNNKVDLIVSSWTLNHLVDPFGTLKRMYSLLTPTQGKLLANGFLLKYDDSDEVITFPGESANVLVCAAITSLYRYFLDGDSDHGEFLLVRNGRQALEIPLEYTGKVYPNNEIRPYGPASKKVTEYRRSFLGKAHSDFVHIAYEFFCLKGDQRCKDLYNSLDYKGLFAGCYHDDDQNVENTTTS